MFATLLLLTAATATPPAGADYHIEYGHALNAAHDFALVNDVIEGVAHLLADWSWANANVKGQWKILFADAAEVQGLQAHALSAVSEDESGQPQLILVWDRVCERSPYPTLTTYQHIAAHLYRTTISKNFERLPRADREHLEAEGVFLALRDVRGSSHYDELPTAAQTQIDRDLSAHLILAHKGLGPAPLSSYGCGQTLSGKAQ